MMEDLCDRVKQTARQAGADLVGIASIDRFDHAPPEVHPRSIFSHTQSVVAVGCRMVRGALKTAEEGLYWGMCNCDSYQYINEVLAPHLLRRIVLLLEDQGILPCRSTTHFIPIPAAQCLPVPRLPTASPKPPFPRFLARLN